MKEDEEAAAAQKTEKFGIKDVINIIGGNDQLKALMGFILSFQMGSLLISGFAIYYFSYAIGREDLFATFMLVSSAVEMAGVFVLPKLCAHINRQIMWKVACAFPILGLALLGFASFVAPESALLIGVAGASFKFGVGVTNGLGTVMLADVVDYGEEKTGCRSDSIIFSMQTMLVKAGAAFAGFAVGIGLGVIGYVPNIEQSETTIMGLKFMMIVLPIILYALSAFIYHRYYTLDARFVSLGKEQSQSLSQPDSFSITLRTDPLTAVGFFVANINEFLR